MTPPAQCPEQGRRNGPASVRRSVCLSHRSIAATAAGGFAAERRRSCGRRSAGAGTEQDLLNLLRARTAFSPEQLSNSATAGFLGLSLLGVSRGLQRFPCWLVFTICCLVLLLDNACV